MKRSGFTMIELIFVIVILGILAAVAIPKLAATRDDAKAASLKSDVGGAINAVPAWFQGQQEASVLNAITLDQNTWQERTAGKLAYDYLAKVNGEAMDQFKDRTGLPGPRNWTSGAFPEGEAEHPVTDVTWYEATAYAEFRGKQLPTVFQWEKAARDGTFTHINALVMPWGLITGPTAGRRANLHGRGTVAVDQFEFGVSPYGCYSMAGNVTEWCASRWGDDFTALGGSWRDSIYMFADYGRFPGFYSSDKIGFRCVLNTSADRGDMSFTVDEEQPIYAPTRETSFKAWLRHYRYDRAPLNAQIVETIETDDYRREKIYYMGANDERAIAYLYLPKNARKPYQVINFVPSGSAFYGGLQPTEGSDFSLFSPHVKSGRAVLVSIYKGCPERPWPVEQRPTDRKSVKYRNRIVSMATDARRGLDYLETRDDIDISRMALMNLSTSFQGLILAAVETRYRSVVFLGYGVYKRQLDDIPESNPIYFAPHIRMPKLIVNGRYDEDFPFKAAAEPLYRLLREPKKLVLYDGGHIPPLEISVPATNHWLDETLGPIKHR